MIKNIYNYINQQRINNNNISYKINFVNKKSTSCIDDINCKLSDTCKIGKQSCEFSVYNIHTCYITSYVQRMGKIVVILRELEKAINKYSEKSKIFKIDLTSRLSNNLDELNRVIERLDKNEVPDDEYGFMKSYCQIL